MKLTRKQTGPEKNPEPRLHATGPHRNLGQPRPNWGAGGCPNWEETLAKLADALFGTATNVRPPAACNVKRGKMNYARENRERVLRAAYAYKRRAILTHGPKQGLNL